MRRGFAAAIAFALACGKAFAQSSAIVSAAPVTAREAFLAAVIGAMMLLGLASFLLQGRVSERTHVAFALLGVLAGAFGLFVLFGGALYGNPLAALVVLLALVALFRLMNQFEGTRRRPKA